MTNIAKLVTKGLFICAIAVFFDCSTKADAQITRCWGVNQPQGDVPFEASKSLPINVKLAHNIMIDQDAKLIAQHSTFYRLGSRELKLGSYGTDVTFLVAELTQAGYLSIGYKGNKHGEDYFDTTIMNAVKHFQRDVGIKEDGIVTKKLANLLKVWDPLCTTRALGSRTLRTEDKTAGYDVDELIILLTIAGFAPQEKMLIKNDPKPISSEERLGLINLTGSVDSTKYEQSKLHYEFTEDIKTALKTFQAFHGIKPTGNLDAQTIKKLLKYKRSD